MKIEIKSIAGTVLFEGDFSCIAEAVKSAVAKRADLRYADLSSANLRYANLRYADLRYTDLRYTDLRYANLSYTDLRYANLRYANLRYADLSYTDLRYADLSYTDLSYTDLSYTDLRSANLRSAKGSGLAIAMTRILPEGDLIGWKKCEKDVIVKLLIPAKAKRSHAFGRKCRAEYAKVLQVIGAKEAKSMQSRYPQITYKKGLTVKPEKPFSLNWQEECDSGIHFFISRLEAENFSM